MTDFLANYRVPYYTKLEPGKYWGYTNKEAYELDKGESFVYLKDIVKRFDEYLGIKWSKMWSPSHHMMGAQQPHPGPHFLETYDKLYEYFQLRQSMPNEKKGLGYTPRPVRRKQKIVEKYPMTEEDPPPDWPPADFVPTFHEDYDDSDDI